jgi:5-methylcytosine-specific restriction protein A
MRVCSEPGCPELVERSGKCETHDKESRREREAGRASASARGYDTEWRKTRATFLAKHRICEDPGGCIEPATDVDHIDGLGPKGPRGHDPSNLRALCHSHHSKRTARDQPAGWNAR